LIRGDMIAGSDSLTRNPASFVHFLYFSLITLSTVGYGDILAVHPLAQMLAATEGILGQLFIAVVVARLVGMQMMASQEASAEANE
ncbi:MAG: potassium channel family protein, partial [Candidatus Binatia bacterium]|nr:potassium channel family protein [Candidatus Binatia bacterium]